MKSLKDIIQYIDAIGISCSLTEEERLPIRWLNFFSLMSWALTLPTIFLFWYEPLVAYSAIVSSTASLIPLIFNYYKKNLLAKLSISFGSCIVHFILCLLLVPNHFFLVGIALGMLMFNFIIISFTLFIRKDEKKWLISSVILVVALYVLFLCRPPITPRLDTSNTQVLSFCVIIYCYLIISILGFGFYKKLANIAIKDLSRHKKHLQQQQTELGLKQIELSEKNYQLKSVLAEKNDFFHTLTHDLRSPINAILGLTEIIQGENDIAKIRQYIDYLSHSAQKTRNLIDNLQQVSFLESTDNINLDYSIFDLHVLIQQTVQQNMFSALKKGQKMTYEKGEPLLVELDFDKTYRVLDNLIGNAIKYSPKHSDIEIKVEFDLGEYAIYVIDKGQGFLEEEKEKAFVKFARLSAKPTGGETSTGLGLYISKKLMQIQAGDVSVQSEGRGLGSTLIIHINKQNVVNKDT